MSVISEMQLCGDGLYSTSATKAIERNRGDPLRVVPDMIERVRLVVPRLLTGPHLPF
jgi:hypothetical protein